MKKFYQKIIMFYDDLVKVSKLTKTKNKKLKILSLALVINILVFLDISIILFLASIFSDNSSEYGKIISTILENKFLLPIFIIFRFFLVFYEKVITTNLQIDIENNLRVYLTEEAFNRGNLSISDAYFYVNTLSQQVGKFYSTLSAFIASVIQIITFSIYLFITNFETVLIFSFGTLFLFIPTFYLTKLGRKYAHKAYIYGQQISDEIEKIFENLFLIKIIGQVKGEISKFTSDLNKYYSARLNEIKIGTANELIPNFFTLFVLSLLILFLDIAKYVTLDFVGILIRLFQSLGIFNRNIHLVSSFHVYLEQLYLIEKNKELVYSENFVLNEDEKESASVVTFENVDFKYLGSEEYLFENLNLEIQKNKHTVLTGFNGSGKSTLLGLASGVFYPTSGSVTINTDRVSYVSATPFILNSTLKNNILYGSEQDVDDKKITDLIKDLKIFEKDIDISLEKIISNKKLSMGQMQKISFARALLSSPDLLILDEATSNLDRESKILIHEILKKTKCTIINSTHNIEDISYYDFHLIIEEKNNQRYIRYV